MTPITPRRQRPYPEPNPGTWVRGMIQLTRIDGTEFYLNPDLIEVLENSHDTHITLTNGHRYVCAETPDVIVERIAAYRRQTMGAIRRSA
jgi:flagellar protein FlbD